MFDGPVDAIWIENMNTVLDDNKKLCLNSGQVIPLTPRMTMMFEVADLAVASPATVSRCGMVYVEPASLGLEPYFVSWLNTLPPKVEENPGMKLKLRELGDKLLEDGVWFVYHDVKEPVKTCANNIIQSLFRLFDCWLADYVETEIKKVTAERVDELLGMTPSLFFFAFIWSLGTTTDLNGRIKFDQWIREKMKECQVEFPMEGLVYDYCFDLKTRSWKNWLETQPEYNVNTQASFNEILVPTVDSIRMKAIT
jgi:dynein heavy chain